MFSFHQAPTAGDRTPVRPSRRFRFEAAPLEARTSPSIVAITEAVGMVGSPKTPRGLQGVAISGTVLANGPVAPTANALLFDEASPETPAVFPVQLRNLGGGHYSYNVPLSVLAASKAGAGHSGHEYAVAITVRDPGGPASSSTTFTAGGLADAPRASSHPGHPQPSGHVRRA